MQSFESLSKQAREAADSNQLDKAVALYQRALTVRPAWAEGWWSLGTLEYDRSDYPQAAVAFRRLIPLAPKNGTAHAMLGLCEFELGQDEKAAKHLEEGVSLGIATNPQLRQVVLFHRGVLFRREGKFESAQKTLGELCSEGVASPEATQELGMVLLRITSTTAPSPDSSGAQVIQRVGHAACLASEKKYDQARDEYSQLLVEFPDFPNLHYAFGLFYADMGNATSAVDQFKLEIARNPQDLSSRLRIATTLYKADSAVALPYALEAVQLDPHLPFAHYILGLLYLDTDDYRKAIPELEIARKAFPQDGKVYFALGSAYSRAGRKKDADEARATFQKLTSAAGNPAPTH